MRALSIYNPGFNVSRGQAQVQVQVQVQKTLDINGLAIGTFEPDGLSPDFYSNQTVNRVYTDAINGNNLLITSKQVSRDHKVTTYIDKGSVLLRKTGTKAVYFKYDHQNTGYLEVGVVVGLNGTPVYSPYHIVENAHDVINTKMAAAGQPNFVKFEGYFTYCTEGLDIYVQYNGVEFFRSKEHGYVGPGSAGVLMTGDAYVRGKIECTFVPNVFTYSDLENKILDPRDYKMVDAQYSTTGSMTEGGYTLTVADASRLEPGDYIMVEPGGEPLFHDRVAGEPGTKSVGISFPYLSYANEAAMRADHTQLDQTYCWLEDTGYVWEFWTNVTPDWYPKGEYVKVAGAPYLHRSNRYTDMAIPKPLRTKIVSKAGNVLTTDMPAGCDTNNANVYFDNIWALTRCTDKPDSNHFFQETYPRQNAYRDLSAFMPTDWTVRLPAGNYAVSETLFIKYQPGLKVIGQGMDNTRFFSPKGVSTSFECPGSPNMEIAHFAWEGNGTKTHYGFPWWVWNPDEQNRIPNNYQYVYTNTHYAAGIRLSGSPGSHIHHVRSKNAFTSAIGISSSSDTIVEFCEIIHTTGTYFYLGWNGVVDLSTNVIIRNNLFDSAEIMGTCECFNGANCRFEDNIIYNGRLSSNSSSGMQLRRNTVIMRANSNPTWLNPNDPIINFNMNAYPGPQSGGVVEDTHITVLGAIDGHLLDYSDWEPGMSIDPTGRLFCKNIKPGIVINDDYSGTQILNSSYTSPGNIGGGQTWGAIGIISTGTGTVVGGFVCHGTTRVNSPIYGSNVGITNGIISRSNLDTLGIKAGVTVTDDNTIGTVTVAP